MLAWVTLFLLAGLVVGLAVTGTYFAIRSNNGAGGAMRQRSVRVAFRDYRTGTFMAKFLAGLGWFFIIVDLIVAICLIALVRTASLQIVMPLTSLLAYGLSSFMGVMIMGLALVVGGQTARAVLDSANDTRRMREVMELAANVGAQPPQPRHVLRT